jgi:hypothetical protein
MLTQEDDVEIHALTARWTVSAIARHNGRDRNTSLDHVWLFDPAPAETRTCCTTGNRSRCIAVIKQRTVLQAKQLGRT